MPKDLFNNVMEYIVDFMFSCYINYPFTCLISNNVVRGKRTDLKF